MIRHLITPRPSRVLPSSNLFHLHPLEPRVLLSGLPPTVVLVTREMFENTTLNYSDSPDPHFAHQIIAAGWAADFASAYHDPESDPLQSIRIDQIPSDGTLYLTVNGRTRRIYYPGQIILADQLPGLSFVPNANFTGPALFYWSAFDGTSFSPTQAATIGVYAPQPIAPTPVPSPAPPPTTPLEPITSPVSVDPSPAPAPDRIVPTPTPDPITTPSATDPTPAPASDPIIPAPTPDPITIPLSNDPAPDPVVPVPTPDPLPTENPVSPIYIQPICIGISPISIITCPIFTTSLDPGNDIGILNPIDILAVFNNSVAMTSHNSLAPASPSALAENTSAASPPSQLSPQSLPPSVLPSNLPEITPTPTPALPPCPRPSLSRNLPIVPPALSPIPTPSPSNSLTR